MGAFSIGSSHCPYNKIALVAAHAHAQDTG